MSENLTNLNQNAQPVQPIQPAPFIDERETWGAERRTNRHGSGAWIGGAILILLGMVFLLQNTGIYILHNWWAVFILFPAFGSFAAAYGMYHNNGNRLNYAVRGSLIGGIFFTLLAGAFLFDVAAGLFWPLILIFIGISMLVNFVAPQ